MFVHDGPGSAAAGATGAGNGRAGRHRSSSRPGVRTSRRASVVAAFGLVALVIAAGCDAGPSPWHSEAAARGPYRPQDQAGQLHTSADGDVLLFASESPTLASGDTNGADDAFVRDMQTGVVTLVSVNAAGTGTGDAPAHPLGISADGTRVLFESAATDLVAEDANGSPDLFVRDLTTGTTTAVSVTPSGATGNGASVNGALSADGTAVAVLTYATDLVPGVDTTTSGADVYVRDLAGGTTALASVTPAGTATGGTEGVSISADGERVVFEAEGGTFGHTDTNHRDDIYLRDLASGTTTLVSSNAADTDAGNNDSMTPVMSRDGSKVAFVSAATDLGPDSAPGWDTFVYDVAADVLTVVSVPGTPTYSDISTEAVFSPDGSTVAFRSETDLADVDSNGTSDVYVRDLDTGELTLVSANASGTSGGNEFSSRPTFDPTGTRVAFTSYASDLGPVDTPESDDVYVRDLATGVTTRASAGTDGTGGEAGYVYWPVFGLGDQVAYIRSGDRASTLHVSSLHGADLATTLDVSPSPVPSGAQATATLTVTNGGPEAAEDVSAGVIVPAGATVVALDGPGACSTAPAGEATLAACQDGDVAPGASLAVTVTLDVDAAAGSTVALTGAVVTPTVDAAPGGTTATATLDVA
jgi:Tol biopolymer transport system component